jgi:hypothetical protein
MKGGIILKKYKVIFHFDKDNWVAVIREGENPESLLEECFAKDQNYIDFANERQVLHRVNMSRVTHVTVSEHKPASIR